MKVGFVTADWSSILKDDGTPTLGGSGWYRMGMPCEWMRRNGYNVVIGELISVASGHITIHDWYGNAHDDCDIIVFQRWMDERAPRVIAEARSVGQVIVNEIDDWFWGLHPANGAYKATDPKLNPQVNRKHYFDSLRASDLIITSTPLLADKLADIDPPKVLLRNCIDLERWKFMSRHTPARKIGWVGATSHRSGDLETLQGVLGPFCERHNMRFVHCGFHDAHPPAGDLAKVPRALQEVHGQASILDYPSLFYHMDIGIVPLNDIPFNNTKSCIKGMEYAASGIPFVAQAVDDYRWLKETHDVGIVAKKPAHWNSSLTKLLDSDFYWDEAIRNRENVKALDIEHNWRSWASLFESLL